MDGDVPVHARDEEAAVEEQMEEKGPKLPPSHPPRTPPPQKKPVEAPRPQPATKPKGVTSLQLPPPGGRRTAALARTRMAIRNRRVANWSLTGDRWAAKKAVARVLETVRGWGYTRPEDAPVEQTVALLVGAAVADSGKRISLHVADQEEMLLVVVLSHTAAEPDEDVLVRLAAVPGVSSCGTDAGPDGRRVWALMETTPPRRRTPAA
ncbi:hypothetical protein [Streptomyces sp. NPDC006463]|uniref:hypothetical protein n=1 Tax=Streptomyces sp. NPDC006463 TaxID=3364746 RepID=UPI00367A3690